MDSSVSRSQTERRTGTYRVLHLTTVPTATFYRQQIEALERHGIECTTLRVPGTVDGGDPDAARTPLDYLKFFPQVLRTASDEYDVVHANFGLTAPHALAQMKLPVVVSFWGTDVFGTYQWISKLSAHLADAVVVMSERMGRELSTDYHVIPHGVDFDKFAPTAQRAAQDELGWDRDAKHVVFPSPTYRPEKDFPRAERVVTAAREQVDDPIRLHTPNQEVPHDRMPVLMNAADTLLLTSKYEGFPNSVKEAMACNLPVVSTDVGGVGRRLSRVDNSVVGTTDDELVTGLVDILRSGERSNGREFIEDLRLDRMAIRLRWLYDDVTPDVR